MALPATAPPHGAQHRSGRAAAAAANLVAQNAAHQAAEHGAPARRVAALRYLHNVDARDTTVLGWIRLLRVRGIRLVVLARWRSARRQRRGQNDACNQREPAGMEGMKFSCGVAAAGLAGGALGGWDKPFAAMFP